MDILAPNRFFHGAEMEYFLFDPKNGAVGVFLRKSENYLLMKFFFEELTFSKNQKKPFYLEVEWSTWPKFQVPIINGLGCAKSR